MAAIHRAAYVVAQKRDVVLGSVMSSARVYRDFSARIGPAIAPERAPQRLSAGLRGKIPERRIEKADCAAAFAVTAGGRFLRFRRCSVQDRRRSAVG
jgi:hypothetical protein